MEKYFTTLLLAILLTGCVFDFQEEAMGRKSIWCNNRYLPEINAEKIVTDELHLKIAKSGYLYALIGAYVLQKDNKERSDHYFSLPSRVVFNPNYTKIDIKTGFEANIFEIYKKDSSDIENVVIAFTGSNDKEDWKTNFSLTNKKQYEQARKYVTTAFEAYHGRKLVVTGYSLGGALSSHVTKHPETSSFIELAWVFNPSPKIWGDSTPDLKIWQASTSNDILKVARWPIFRILPGVAYCGAYSGQRAENFYLIKSNPVYAHFRWALARNILHTADLAIYLDNPHTLTSEPLEILKMSKCSACPETL